MLPVKHQKSWCSVFFLLVFNQIMKIMNIQYVFFFLQIFVLSEIPTILPTFFFPNIQPNQQPRGNHGRLPCRLRPGISKAAHGAVAAFGSRSGQLQTPPMGVGKELGFCDFSDDGSRFLWWVGVVKIYKVWNSNQQIYVFETRKHTHSIFMVIEQLGGNFLGVR